MITDASTERFSPDSVVEYNEVKRDFRLAQNVEQILRQMLASASVVVEKLKGDFNTMTNKRVLHTLPDEILAIILEHCCGRGADLSFDALNKIILVSHHFRDILFRIPSIWSRFPQLHLERAERYASRATRPEIEMVIRGVLYASDREMKRVPGLYSLAVSVSSRIRTLSLTLSSFDLPHLETILQTCSSMTLPFLEDLSLSCSSVGPHCTSLCSNWDMPSLRRLGISDILPTLAFSVLPQIKACTVVANWGNQTEDLEEDEYLEATEVVEFLASLTSVEVLQVDVRLLDEYIGPEGPSMGTVKKMTLILRTLEVAKATHIMDIIQFPNILSLKLEFGLPDVESLDEALGATSSSSVFEQSVTSVTHLQLSLDQEFGDTRDRPFNVINDWCTRFEDLQSIILENKREKGHGLLSFAGSIDAIRVSSTHETIPEDSISRIPDLWKRTKQRKVAVFNSDFLEIGADFDEEEILADHCEG